MSTTTSGRKWSPLSRDSVMALPNCSAFSAHSSVVRTHSPLFFSSSPRAHFSLSISIKQNPRASNDDSRSVSVSVGEEAVQSLCVSKRELTLSILAVLLNGSLPTMALAQDMELERYVDAKAGFTLLRPSSWVQVEKAGATVLFEEPNKGSNNVGVVVNPVRLSSLGEFGTPEFVADKLIQAERRKESTKEAEVIGVAERSGHGGLQVYEFEYKVDSTRGGMKRIFSAAFVASKKLYLLNIAYSDKPESPLDALTRASLEEVLHSFDSAPMS